MDKAQFWRLIEDAKAKSGGDCEEQTQVLAQGLKQLPLCGDGRLSGGAGAKTRLRRPFPATQVSLWA